MRGRFCLPDAGTALVVRLHPGRANRSGLVLVREPAGLRYSDGFNAFYFSFVTLSTVGFGDVAPVSKVARTLAVMEAITGMFYVAVLIARLVAMYSPARPEPTDSSAQL